MSLLSGLFGKKKAAEGAPAAPAPKPQVDLVGQVARLEAHRATIEKSREMYEKRALASTKKAIELNRKGDKKGAIMELKRKKLADQQVAKSLGMMTIIENQMAAMQSLNLNREHLDVIGSAAEAMKAAQADVNIDKLDDVREKYEEVMDTHREVEAELTRGFGVGDMDDSELEAELAELTEEDLTATLTAPAATAAVAAAPAPAPAVVFPSLPSAPTGKISPVPVAAGAGPVAAGGAGGGSMLDELAALEAM